MTADFWAEAYRIFSEALDHPSGSRQGFAALQAAGRPDLLREVEALLTAHEASGGFLELRAAADGDASRRIAGGIGPGDIAGAWRLLALIGEGGMGRVFRAERTDGGFAQQAAVKVTRVSLLQHDQARRFRAERAILAGLQHPHIVGLLDGGSLASGEAWLAMEFVDGVPITRYAEEHGVDLATRLRLFRDVCSAVHHAHQHGVVHRDLKAQNVLVSRSGVVKVVDFGLAKLLETPTSGETTMTGAAPVPLTPNTASPEQWRGLTVTTAADIYSLGVLLYELVAGARPYDTTGKPLDEALAIVTARTPVRPSAAAALRVPGPEPQVPGPGPWPRANDLDAIVLKALEKEPQRRYESAAAFSADVARYLDGRPVTAREPSFWYVARRTIRRHALASAAIAVALVAVFAGLGVSMWQARVAERERQRAEARLADVRQLANTLVFKVHDAVTPLAGSTPVREMIVKEALGYLERLSAEPGNDPTLRLELSAAYTRIGNVQGNPQQANLGDVDGALLSLRRATDLVQPLVSDPDPPIRGSALAATAAADTALQSIYSTLGRKDEAIAAAQRSVAAMEQASGALPADDTMRRRLGSAYFSLALALQGTPGAVDQWHKAGAVFEGLLREQPDSPDRLRNVALVAKYLGGEYDLLQQPDQGETQAVRALGLDERRLAVDPTARMVEIDVSNDLVSLAGYRTKRGDTAAAAQLLDRALRIRERAVESDPKDALAPGKVGSVEWRLAHNALAAGDREEARRWADRAVATMSRIRERSRDVITLRDYAAAQAALALAAADPHRPGGSARPGLAACAAARRARTTLDELASRGVGPLWHILTEDLPTLEASCPAS